MRGPGENGLSVARFGAVDRLTGSDGGSFSGRVDKESETVVACTMGEEEVRYPMCESWFMSGGAVAEGLSTQR